LTDCSLPLAGCRCCGLIQTLPAVPAGQRAVCRRCHTALAPAGAGHNQWTMALTLSALVFYVPALCLPMLRLEQFGHVHESSLLAGVGALWSQGQWFVGTVVFVFSILLPPLKLIALWLLSATALISRHRQRAVLYHLVELLGRWGMLDVMLVAILVAFVKLGDVITIRPGSGLFAFGVLILLSLSASVVFNPTLLWDAATQERDDGR
jgi:paraquat-inducible protein A